MRVGVTDALGAQLGREDRLGRITRQGSRLLPWALIEAALKNPIGGGVLREQYERIAKRHGTTFATVAIARQILTLSYYGLRDAEIRRLEAPVWRAA